MSLLEPVVQGQVEVGACVRCGGLWFDPGELAAAIRVYDPGGVRADRVADDLGPYRRRTEHACPACREGLGEYELSPSNPLLVDVCGGCGGVWLDGDEYAHAVAGRLVADAKQAMGAKPGWGAWFLQFLTGLPVEFNIAPRRAPLVTYGLIAVNCFIFAVGMFRVGHGYTLKAMALDPAQLGSGRWWLGLFTSQFAHADVFHLLGNMYFLWVLGDNVEDVLGRARFILFYLAAGVCGGVFYSLTSGTDPMPAVGASGAISGVLGAYAVLFSRSRLTFMLVVWQFKVAAWAWVTIWVLFNLAGWAMESPGVAWEAHVGGLAFGLVVAGACYRPLMRANPVLRLLHGKADEFS